MSFFSPTFKKPLNLFKLSYFCISLLFLTYLLLPDPVFPDPPVDSVQSGEPGDTESEYRRAYFTNFTRGEVLKHYEDQFYLTKLQIKLPQYRLNYPPEEAQTIIRDQTRSTFLEEIVHPFRESVFINGYEPKEEKDTIYIDDKVWRQKIIVRYVPSDAIIRSLIGLTSIILIYLIAAECFNILKYRKLT